MISADMGKELKGNTQQATSQIFCTGTFGANISDAFPQTMQNIVLLDTDEKTLAIRPNIKSLLCEDELSVPALKESINSSYASFSQTCSVVLLAGLGGKAGTGISLVLSEMAFLEGRKVFGFFTTPFSWEAKERHSLAERAVYELAELGVISSLYRNDDWGSIASTGLAASDFFDQRDNEIVRDVLATQFEFRSAEHIYD